MSINNGFEPRIMLLKASTAAAFVFVMILSVSGTPARSGQGDKPAHSVWDGAFTKEQAKRGEGVYAQFCSSCHGPDLSGNDEAAPLMGAAFLANWDGLTIGDLAERVRVSMPPNNVGKLNRQQITDVLSYVLSVNSFPVGKAELDPKAESLKQIRIEATKPKSESRSD